MNKSKYFNSRGNQSIVQTLLVVLLIGAAFFIGMLWTRVKTLEDPSAKANAGVPAAANNGAAAAPTAPPTRAAKDVKPVSDDDNRKGGNNPKVALIEYSDFDCPFCSRFHPTAQQAVSEYGEDLVWVYRHFPLDQLHPDARKKAEASECVAKLGGNEAFWTFADKIIAESTAVSGLADAAASSGVNKGQFESCLNNGETKQAVEDDYQSGLAAGVTGTPGNIIMNIETGETELLPGAVPFSMVKASIDKMMGN